MKIIDLLKFATDKLKDSCPRPRFEAELLLSFYLKKDRVYLHAFGDEAVENLEGFKEILSRRAKHEPYEYITKSVSFYDIELNIDRGALIPRPETEILIDIVAKIIEKENITFIAEIGIGSGAISIVLARKFPNLKIIATEISDRAIEVARMNIDRFGLKDRIEIKKTSLLDGIENHIELVVSNPPYISNGFKLESHILNYEPKEALFGGVIGDELIKEIIIEVKNRNIKYLACEMGYDQKESLEKYFLINGIKNYYFYKDLANLDRGFLIYNI